MALNTGAVIRLRKRLWRVDHVDNILFSATPLDGRDVRRWRFLRSLEEQNVATGELPPPDPSQFSDPATQDLLLRAYRLNLMHGSAPFLGLQRSRAIPEPYQLVPLLMALNLDRVRLLIGDDVGVGKSIEAGLIVSELIARGDAERVLLVVPAGLREQWQETLDRFFHLDAVIMAGHTRPALERQLIPGQSPWSAFPIVIASIDYLKRRIGEVCSHRWDVVLVDEAHIAARPHAWSGMSQQDKERWELLLALSVSEKVQHMVLLSATPHNGYTDSFTSLLEVLNPQCVKGETILKSIASRHVVQRRRIDIQNWYNHQAPLPKREQDDVVLPLSRAEQNLMAGLRAYSVLLAHIEGSNVGQWVSLHLQRRALSSPGSIVASLQKRIRVAKTRHQRPAEGNVAQMQLEAESIVFDMDSTADLADEQRWTRLDAAAVGGTQKETETLQDLLVLAKKVTAAQDRKLAHLVEMLPRVLSRHKRLPRALVFTRYKDTLTYLETMLKKEGRRQGLLHGLSVFTIHGEMNQAERRTLFRAFEQTDRAVCIATDCISEGVDLQRACAELIHYELPWNPNRLEQRNGRIDRYGQPEDTVYVSTLVRDDPLDVTILEVLVRKAARIRRDHGFCPPIFSSTGELKKLMRRHGALQLQLQFDEDSDSGDDLDADAVERLQRIVDESFYGQEEVRLPEVEAALERTYRVIGRPEEVQGFVYSALNLVGATLQEKRDGTLEILLANTPMADLGDTLLATFDPRIARDDPSLELIDVAHPLMRRLVEHVVHRAAGRQEGRVAIRGTQSVKQMTAVVHILARYVTQSEQPVLMEELIPIAYHPYGETACTADPVELLRSPAAAIHYTEAESVELAAHALESPWLASLRQEAVEARRQELEKRQGDLKNVAAQWARGMDSLTVASVDTLTLTLLVPAHG